MSRAATEVDRVTPGSHDEAGPAPQWLYRMWLSLYKRIADLGDIRNVGHVILLDGILIQTGTKARPTATPAT